MKYYIETDATGAVIGSYTDWDDAIPAGAIEVTADEYTLVKTGVPCRHDGTAVVEDLAADAQAELDDAKAEKLIALRADYESLLAGGVQYDGAVFETDAKSTTALAETLTAVANGWTLPAGFVWRDSANVDHPADVAWLKGLATAMADHKAAAFRRLSAAKDAVRAAGTVADVEAVQL